MTQTKPVLGLNKPKATMVRIGTPAHDKLREMAEQEQTSQRALLEYAIDLLDRHLYFKRIRAGYAAQTQEEHAEALAEQGVADQLRHRSSTEQ